MTSNYFAAGAVVLMAAAAVGAQQAPPQRDQRDVDARIEVADAQTARGFAVDAPSAVPIKKTNYAVPVGALFVAPDGRADRPGTDVQAPTTLENAIKTTPPGGTIVLRGGTYRVGGLVLPRRVTLQAYAGHAPWLKGSVVVAGWTRDGGDAWRHDNWKFHFPPRGYNATVLDKITDPKFPMSAHSDMVFVNSRALFQVGSRAEVKPGRFFVDYKAGQLFLGDDPAGKLVEACARENGVSVTKRDAFDSSGSVIRGLGLAHYADGAVQISAPNVAVEDCTIVWNANSGLNFHPWAGGVKGALPADCVARGNTFAGNGASGMSAGQAPHLLVEKNTISFNNVEGFKRSWGAAGVKVVQSANFVCKNNVVENNYATGIWMDVDVNNAVAHHNVVRRNQGLGIFFEISDQCIIAFNVVHDNSTGIQISNSTRARVYNNTLVNNGKAFYAQWWKRVNHEGNVVAGIARGQEYVTRDNVFKNNLVVYTKPAKGPILEAQGGPEKSSARFSSDHNTYYLAEPARQTPFARWAKNGGEPLSYATLADFRRIEPNYEQNARVLSAPLFVDANAGDFRLRPGSPPLGTPDIPDDIAALAGAQTGVIN